MEIVVKIDPRRVEDPAAYVRRLLERASRPSKDKIVVEEIFPGLRTGRSAGLVSLVLPDPVAQSHTATLLETLRADQAVEYVEAPKPRRAK